MTASRAAPGHEPPLSPAAVEMLAWVAQHRLLATSQVAALRGPDASRRWTRALLSDLERRGLLASVRARGQRKLWHLTERGGALVQTTS
jgi:chromosome segregation and condensation protein ScpB